MKEHRHFAPMPEVEWFSVFRDGKKLPGIIPYKGDHTYWVDDLRQLRGVDVKPATPDEHRRNRTRTTLHKRIIKCFVKHCEKAGFEHGYGDLI